MGELQIQEAWQLSKRLSQFLRDASGAPASFAVDEAGTNYWRETMEAEAPNVATPAIRNKFRPTVTFFLLEAQYLLIDPRYEEDPTGSRKKWISKTIAMLERLDEEQLAVKGPWRNNVLSKMRSSLSPDKHVPNILSVSHLGMLLARLAHACRTMPGGKDLLRPHLQVTRVYKREVSRFLSARLRQGARWDNKDKEHPYLMYRLADWAVTSSRGNTSGLKSMLRRAEAEFHRLSAAVSHGIASPAEYVDLALVWSVLALLPQDSVSNMALEACARSIMQMLRKMGDWPIGHALSASSRSAVIPSGEVSGAILNALMSSKRWNTFPCEAMSEALGCMTPYAERLMQSFSKHRLKTDGRTLSGWTDSRTVRDPTRLQGFTTASHLLFLARFAQGLREFLRAKVVQQLGGQLPSSIKGPPFEKITEVDHRVPLVDYIYSGFVRTVDPLAKAKNIRRFPVSCSARKKHCEKNLTTGGEKPSAKVDPCRLILPSKKSENISFVLFGPPGTGKTTYVKAIAKALDWPLITITPGNFIQEGEGGIETAAQKIFGLLSKVDRVVVLLDECEELFRSRGGRTRSARTLLDFLTASMLPKLADLHDRGQLILAVATNYIHEMDLAAIRKGRIDRRIAVPPPDQESRAIILCQFLANGKCGMSRRRALLCRRLCGQASELTEGFTRGELGAVAKRLAQMLEGDGRKCTKSALKKKLAIAVKGRANDAKLLQEFYEKVRLNSDPVVDAGDSWQIPEEFRKTGKARKWTVTVTA